MKEFDVFISYSRDDDSDYMNDPKLKSPIEQILERFKKAGIKVWIDREGRYIGENYLREIVKGINNSEMMLFVSSKNSNTSYFAPLEVSKAADKKMKIFLLLLDDTPLHEDIDLLFSAKDKRWFYPNTSKTLDELAENIKKDIDKIAKIEREKAEAEEAERRKIEEEKEKERLEKEEKERIMKLEQEIENIKKSIVRYIEKQQICMKELLSKEKDLNRSSIDTHECPVCQTSISDDVDFCDICGWHLTTPKEIVSVEMQKTYEERLHTSQTIWKEIQQRKTEVDFLKKEKTTLAIEKDGIEKELADYKKKYNACLEDNKKLIQTKQTEIKKLENELKDTKFQMLKIQQQVKELSKKKEEKSTFNPYVKGKHPIAFLLVTEFDQMNAYCLYEGRNVFGSMQADKGQSEYQMLVVSDDNLNPQHFEINMRKENKRYEFSISPINNTCILKLNSPSNLIKTKNIIHINDLLFIGDIKIQIIDNFNKIN